MIEWLYFQPSPEWELMIDFQPHTPKGKTSFLLAPGGVVTAYWVPRLLYLGPRTVKVDLTVFFSGHVLLCKVCLFGHIKSPREDCGEIDTTVSITYFLIMEMSDSVEPG